jgi:hypothetical protein
MKFFSTTKGFATIPTILVLSVLILVAATGIAAVTYTQTQATAIAGQSSLALGYAETGTRDALMRLARNFSYSCASADCYSLDMLPSGCSSGLGCAKVSVSANAGTKADPKIITAKGIVQNETRKLQVQVIYDSNAYGIISTTTWSELTN